MISPGTQLGLDQLKCLDDDDQHDVDQDERAGDGKDEEHETGGHWCLTDGTELEFVQHHGEASLQGGDHGVELQHVIVKDHVEHLDKGHKDQDEHGQESRQILKIGDKVQVT